MSRRFTPEITELSLTPESGPVGSTFSCSVSIDAHPPARVSYEWKLDGRTIPGAIGSKYVADTAGELSVVVAATNNQGTTTKESAPALVAEAGATPRIARVAVSPECGFVGDTFAAIVEADGDPEPELAYQWMLDEKPISGATSSSHAATVEGDLSVVVTATNTLGTDSRESAGAVVAAGLAAPANVEEPTIAGTPEVGETLTSSDGTWTGNPTPALLRNWQRSGVDIAGQTAGSYVMRSEDNGTDIRLRVTATNSEGTATAHSAALTVPAFTAPAIMSASISPSTGVVGTEFLAEQDVTGNPAPTLSYQWTLDGTAIDGAIEATHTAAAEGVLGVVISATNSEGVASRTVDGVVVKAALAAPVISDAQVSPSSGFVGDGFVASATVTGNPVPTLSYQWTLDGAAIDGAAGATHTADAEGALSCVIIATNPQGSARAETSAVSVVGQLPLAVFKTGVFQPEVFEAA